MNTIENNLSEIKRDLPSDVNLVAVSKFHPVENIRRAYDAGQKIFGESRPQELISKVSILPSDIEWHFIGHLQTNKLKMVLPYVSLIHSVDSLRLLNEINKYSTAHNLIVNCLLEAFISQDETKQGFSPLEIESIICDYAKLNDSESGIRICGLMGMATLTDDTEQIAKEFTDLKHLYDDIRGTYSERLPYFNKLSMGMSNDYEIAIKCGSNLVRIGTAIFGEREIF